MERYLQIKDAFNCCTIIQTMDKEIFTSKKKASRDERQVLMESMQKSMKRRSKAAEEYKGILKGQNIYLLTMLNGQQVETHYRNIIQMMGGTIKKRINENITVAVVNQINMNIVKKLTSLKIPIVSILWVLACYETFSKQPYEDFIFNSSQLQKQLAEEEKNKEEAQKSLNYFLQDYGSHAKRIAEEFKRGSKNKKLAYFTKGKNQGQHVIEPLRVKLPKEKQEKRERQKKRRYSKVSNIQQKYTRRNKSDKLPVSPIQQQENDSETNESFQIKSTQQVYQKYCRHSTPQKLSSIIQQQLSKSKTVSIKKTIITEKQYPFIPICVSKSLIEEVITINHKRKSQGFKELKLINSDECQNEIFIISDKNYKLDALIALASKSKAILKSSFLKQLEKKFPSSIEAQRIKQYQIECKIIKSINNKKFVLMNNLLYSDKLKKIIQKLGGIIISQVSYLFENITVDFVISNRKMISNKEETITEKNFVDSLLQIY